MTYVIIGIGLVFAAAAALIVLRMRAAASTEARTRVTVIAVAFAVCVAAGLTGLLYAQIYYRIPVAVLVGLLAVWLVAIALAVAVAGLLGRTARTVLAVAGLFVTIAAATIAVAMTSPLGSPTALIETRAAQIAEANGFVALLPADEQMETDYLPVDTIDDGGIVLTVEYEAFFLHERKAEQPLSEDDLRALVAPGSRPVALAEVSRDASITVTDVNGRPAVGATFLWSPPEAAIKGLGTQDAVSILVFELDGVDIRMESRPQQRYTSTRGQETVPALTVEELVAIAKKLAPVK